MMKTKTKLACCTPYSVPFPSGWALVHSKSCGKFPNEKVGRETHPVGRARIAEMGVFESHAKCRAAHSWGGRVCSRCAPRLHAADCDCTDCEYASFHMDDAR